MSKLTANWCQAADLPAPLSYADQLGRQLQLKPMQHSDLQVMVSLGNNLQRGDLLTRLLIQSQNFHTQNLLAEYLAKTSRTEQALGNVQQTLQDLKVIFTNRWIISDATKQNILHVTRVAIMNPLRTSYCNLLVDVEDMLHERSREYGLRDVFKNDTSLKTLRFEIKRVCSSIRSRYQSVIRDSIFGENTKSLEQAYTSIVEEFGVADVIRRFARENPEAVNMEDIDALDDSFSDTTLDGSERVKKRYRTISDAWFEMKLIEWGKNLENTKWSRYVNDTLEQEKMLFDSNGFDILPTLQHHSSQEQHQLAFASDFSFSSLTSDLQQGISLSQTDNFPFPLSQPRYRSYRTPQSPVYSASLPPILQRIANRLPSRSSQGVKWEGSSKEQKQDDLDMSVTSGEISE
ncbi:hypothetical protein EW146_g1620 [Bondarzewia mesenterica]|uniref:Uncharacterized protein n=1 Tax=Bondarzewia mesenterica TaxID=1095465 RepID=A0A4S4M4P7_9AGAM|nr:hypothetical protein EW146_g1620 [Bondarzewia mesenterica]